MYKITVIGAGKTGRGFLGRLFCGEEITFIDKNEKLVFALEEKKSFTVRFFGNKAPAAEVGYKAAYTWEQVQNIDADIIFVSVGGGNLADVGKSLKNFVKAGQRIIVCENASHPAEKLYAAMGIDGVRISESTVFCTTVKGERLDIDSEWYPFLQFDARPMADDLPQIENLKPIFGFDHFLTRKLYTYNSASCIIAYLGYDKGYTDYAEAANDKEILALLDKNYAEIDDCMCREFGYEKADQHEFSRLSRDKFTDRSIADTVFRNGREPQRKIAAGERIVGPLLLEKKYGKDTSVLEKTLAAALLFTPDGEEEWKKILTQKGYEGVLNGICGLGAESEICRRVLDMAKSGKIL